MSGSSDESGGADPIEFWFDFGSGYAYFAHLEIDRIERETGCDVLWRPFMLGTAFKVTGAQGLTSTPIKGDYARRDWQRLAEINSAKFAPPDTHPVIALAASRIFYGIEETAPEKARHFAEACFRRYYGNGEDISNDGVLVTCLYDARVRADKVAFAEDAALKDILKQRGAEALAKGVFGSPFFLWRGEAFWGADRIDMLIAWVRRYGR